MRDTPDHIIQMQRDILHSKTPAQRFEIGLDLINLSRLMVESSIKNEKPQISESDLKIEVFKRCYKGFFNAGEFEKIINAMAKYLKSSVTS